MATKKKTASRKINKVSSKSPLRVGNAVLIRTVTTFVLGRVEEIGEHEIVLSDAGWVADTGRFGECLRAGRIGEYERSRDGFVAVGRGAIADVWNWAHTIPQESI